MPHIYVAHFANRPAIGGNPRLDLCHFSQQSICPRINQHFPSESESFSVIKYGKWDDTLLWSAALIFKGMGHYTNNNIINKATCLKQCLKQTVTHLGINKKAEDRLDERKAARSSESIFVAIHE